MTLIKIYKIILFAWMIVFASFNPSKVNAQLAKGIHAPDFSARAALAGNEFPFTLADALKKGPVVVYFYPKAFTTGCTIEANLFAEASDKFAQYKTTVIGVSADDIDTLLKFSTGPCGGKFAEASDSNHNIIKSYAAANKVRPNMADRISYVITPDQKILSVINSPNPDQHVDGSLKAVQAWQNRASKL